MEQTTSDALPPRGTADLSHIPLDHIHAAVAAAVHDRLIPQPLRGPAVAFADKVNALSQMVAVWTDQLKSRPEPELQSLARYVGRCAPYGAEAGAQHQPGAKRKVQSGFCGNRVCPHCFSRSVDKAYRWLAWSRRPFVHVHVTTAALSGGVLDTKSSLKNVRSSTCQTLRARRVNEYALLRVAMGVEATWMRRWEIGLTVVVPSDQPAAQAFWLYSIYSRERPLPQPHVFSMDPTGMRSMAEQHFAFWEGLLSPDFIDRMSEYLACVGRKRELQMLN